MKEKVFSFRVAGLLKKVEAKLFRASKYRYLRNDACFCFRNNPELSDFLTIISNFVEILLRSSNIASLGCRAAGLPALQPCAQACCTVTLQHCGSDKIGVTLLLLLLMFCIATRLRDQKNRFHILCASQTVRPSRAQSYVCDILCVRLGRKLFGTLLFMVTFLVVIFLQRDVQKSFGMEDTLLRKLQGSLPQDSAGYFNSDSRGTGTLENADELYDWIGNSLDTMYLDAVCGEGSLGDPNVLLCVCVCACAYICL